MSALSNASDCFQVILDAAKRLEAPGRLKVLLDALAGEIRKHYSSVGLDAALPATRLCNAVRSLSRGSMTRRTLFTFEQSKLERKHLALTTPILPQGSTTGRRCW